MGQISINRSNPFNPAEFIGAGWTIWRGPADGNGLQGEEEQDARSLALTEVDLGGVILDAALSAGENSTSGEERLRRLAVASGVKMDAKIFQTLWENKKMIPERMKEKTNGNITFVFADGTILRSPSGIRYSLYFCWDADYREWFWDSYWLADDRDVHDPSALLAS